MCLIKKLCNTLVVKVMCGMNPAYEQLIENLKSEGYLKNQEIVEAFKSIDRADFVLDEDKERVYVNAPLSIGFGQTISQPLVVAFMIELLRPKTGEKILDVGCGSGWTTGILANIVGNGGKVVGIERIPELKEMAEKNISKYDFIKNKTVEIVLGDGSKGYKNEAPYDKILAGAAASGTIPVAWKRQLKIGGRIVAPVGESIVMINRISKNQYNKEEYFGYSFVPLVEK